MAVLTASQARVWAWAIASVGVVGAVGNILVILAILSSSKLRSTAMNTLLVNMAFADLFFITTLDATWVPYYWSNNWKWIWPDWLCQPYNYFNNLCLHVSILTYIAISIERYLVIVHPFSVRSVLGGGGSVGSRRCNMNVALVAVIWAVMAVLDIPDYLAFAPIIVNWNNESGFGEGLSP